MCYSIYLYANMHEGMLYVMYVHVYIRVWVSSCVYVAWHSNLNQFGEIQTRCRRFKFKDRPMG